MGQDRLRRARDCVLRQGPARRPLSRNVGRQFLQDHADQLLLAHRGCPTRGKAVDRRRLDPDVDLLWCREMDAALQRHGGREGGAGGERALSRRRPRREEHPRQRDLRGSDQDGGRVRHRRLPLHPQMERVQRTDAPHGYDGGSRRQRALSVVGPFSRRYRRGTSRGFRLPCRWDEATRRPGYLAQQLPEQGIAGRFELVPTIYYIRHGETDWNAEGKLQGTRDIPLNDLGRKQAAQAGAILATLFERDERDEASLRFVASPLGRARGPRWSWCAASCGCCRMNTPSTIGCAKSATVIGRVRRCLKCRRWTPSCLPNARVKSGRCRPREARAMWPCRHE